MNYPAFVDTRIRDDDPEWAHEIISELYRSVYEHAQRKISGHGLQEPTLPAIDLHIPDLGPESITASVIRGVARRLGRPMPPELMDPSSEVLARLIDSGPDVVDVAVHEAKMDFQRPGGTTQVYVRVTRNGISIEGVTPHRISL
jgi:hypothetical protein